MPRNSTTHRSYGQVGLHNRPRPNLNILIERPHATSYLIVIVMFGVSISDCEIFTVEMCMTLTLNFRMDQDQI